MAKDSAWRAIATLVAATKDVTTGARKSRKETMAYLSRTETAVQTGRDAVRHEIQSVPDDQFPGFVQGLFERAGFKVRRLARSHPYRAHAVARSESQTLMIRSLEAVPRGQVGIHVARAVDELALQCELEGMRGVYVTRDLVIEPTIVRRSGSDREGASISAMYLDDLVDLAIGHCVNDPATGYTLIDLAQGKPALAHSHHAYTKNTGGAPRPAQAEHAYTVGYEVSGPEVAPDAQTKNPDPIDMGTNAA